MSKFLADAAADAASAWSATAGEMTQLYDVELKAMQKVAEEEKLGDAKEDQSQAKAPEDKEAERIKLEATVKKLMTKLKASMKEAARFKGRITELEELPQVVTETSLKETDTSLPDTKEELATALSQLSQYRHQVHEGEQERLTLSLKIDDLQEALDGIDSRLKDSKSSILRVADLEVEINAASTKILALESRLEEADRAAREEEIKLRSANEQLERELLSLTESYSLRLVDLENEIKLKTADEHSALSPREEEKFQSLHVVNLESEISDGNVRVSDLERELEIAHTKAREGERIRDNEQSEITQSYSLRLLDLENEISVANMKAVAFEIELKEMYTAEEIRREAEAQIAIDVDGGRNMLEDANDQLKVAQREILFFTESSSIRVVDLESELVLSQEKAAVQELAIEEGENKLRDADNQLELAQRDLLLGEKERDYLSLKIDDLQKMIGGQKEIFDGEESRLQLINDQLDTVQRNLLQVEKERDILSLKTDDLQAIIFGYKKDLYEGENKLKDAIDRLELAQRDLLSLTESSSLSTMKVADLKEEISVADKKIAAMDGEAEEARKEAETQIAVALNGESRLKDDIEGENGLSKKKSKNQKKNQVKAAAMEVAVEEREREDRLRDANDQLERAQRDLLTLTESSSLSTLRVADLEEEIIAANEKIAAMEGELKEAKRVTGIQNLGGESQLGDTDDQSAIVADEVSAANAKIAAMEKELKEANTAVIEAQKGAEVQIAKCLEGESKLRDIYDELEEARRDLLTLTDSTSLQVSDLEGEISVIKKTVANLEEELEVACTKAREKNNILKDAKEESSRVIDSKGEISMAHAKAAALEREPEDAHTTAREGESKLKDANEQLGASKVRVRVRVRVSGVLLLAN
jgi:chromosome segregation ATPase